MPSHSDRKVACTQRHLQESPTASSTKSATDDSRYVEGGVKKAFDLSDAVGAYVGAHYPAYKSMIEHKFEQAKSTLVDAAKKTDSQVINPVLSVYQTRGCCQVLVHCGLYILAFVCGFWYALLEMGTRSGQLLGWIFHLPFKVCEQLCIFWGWLNSRLTISAQSQVDETTAYQTGLNAGESIGRIISNISNFFLAKIMSTRIAEACRDNMPEVDVRNWGDWFASQLPPPVVARMTKIYRIYTLSKEAPSAVATQTCTDRDPQGPGYISPLAAKFATEYRG